ncbi:MAG: hypothetical protein LBP53_07130 [Candidatus Peribacteria bacterium]|nr:hypothetical protein [Candidatus Peribacteria bacterium]
MSRHFSSDALCRFYTYYLHGQMTTMKKHFTYLATFVLLVQMILPNFLYAETGELAEANNEPAQTEIIPNEGTSETETQETETETQETETQEAENADPEEVATGDVEEGDVHNEDEEADAENENIEESDVNNEDEEEIVLDEGEDVVPYEPEVEDTT